MKMMKRMVALLCTLALALGCAGSAAADGEYETIHAGDGRIRGTIAPDLETVIRLVADWAGEIRLIAEGNQMHITVKTEDEAGTIVTEGETGAEGAAYLTFSAAEGSYLVFLSMPAGAEGDFALRALSEQPAEPEPEPAPAEEPAAEEETEATDTAEEPQAEGTPAEEVPDAAAEEPQSQGTPAEAIPEEETPAEDMTEETEIEDETPEEEPAEETETPAEVNPDEEPTDDPEPAREELTEEPESAEEETTEEPEPAAAEPAEEESAGEHSAAEETLPEEMNEQPAETETDEEIPAGEEPGKEPVADSEEIPAKVEENPASETPTAEEAGAAETEDVQEEEPETAAVTEETEQVQAPEEETETAPEKEETEQGTQAEEMPEDPEQETAEEEIAEQQEEPATEQPAEAAEAAPEAEPAPVTEEVAAEPVTEQIPLTEEELTAQGYVSAAVIRAEGAAIYPEEVESAEITAWLDAGTRLYVRIGDTAFGQAQAKLADGTTLSGWVKLEDIALLITEATEEELPVRTIRVTSTLDEMPVVTVGTEVELRAELTGFTDEDRYTVQWQYTQDGGETVLDAEGANELTWHYIVNKQNYSCAWRVMLTLLAPAEDAAEQGGN